MFIERLLIKSGELSHQVVGTLTGSKVKCVHMDLCVPQRVWKSSVGSCAPSSVRRTWPSGWPARSTSGRPTPNSPPRPRASTPGSSTLMLRKRYVRSSWACLNSKAWPHLCYRFQVNLDSETREALTGGMDAPADDTFVEAQRRIFTLMAKDSFPRFLRSPFCQHAVRAAWDRQEGR